MASVTTTSITRRSGRSRRRSRSRRPASAPTAQRSVTFIAEPGRPPGRRQQRRKRNTPGPPGFNSSQQIGAWDKRARGLARGDIQFEEATRLRTANSNAYLQSLLEPELQLGIGVPDDITLKTSILHLDERFDVTTDAAGCAAFTMFPGIKQFLRVFGTTGGLGVTWADTANLDATEATPIIAGYGQYRPVSASMEFVPTQSQNNDQGEVTVGLRPECDDLAGITVSASTSFLEDHDVVAMKHGCRVIWAPRDPKDQEYQLTSANVNDGGSGTATGSIMVIAISGAQASVKIGSLHIVMNLEAIPVTGGFFAKSSSSSPSCSPAVDHARNVVAAPGMQITRPHGPAVASKARQDSFWSRAWDVVKEYGPAVAKAVVSAL